MTRRDMTVVERALGEHFKTVVAGTSGKSFEATGVTFPAEALRGYANAVIAELRPGSRFADADGREMVVTLFDPDEAMVEAGAAAFTNVRDIFRAMIVVPGNTPCAAEDRVSRSESEENDG